MEIRLRNMKLDVSIDDYFNFLKKSTKPIYKEIREGLSD